MSKMTLIMGRNPVGLIDRAAEEIAGLLSSVKEQEINNYAKRSAISLKDGEYMSSMFSNDKNPNGFEYAALEL